MWDAEGVFVYGFECWLHSQKLLRQPFLILFSGDVSPVHVYVFLLYLVDTGIVYEAGSEMGSSVGVASNHLIARDECILDRNSGIRKSCKPAREKLLDALQPWCDKWVVVHIGCCNKRVKEVNIVVCQLIWLLRTLDTGGEVDFRRDVLFFSSTEGS